MSPSLPRALRLGACLCLLAAGCAGSTGETATGTGGARGTATGASGGQSGGTGGATGSGGAVATGGNGVGTGGISNGGSGSGGISAGSGGAAGMSGTGGGTGGTGGRASGSGGAGTPGTGGGTAGMTGAAGASMVGGIATTAGTAPSVPAAGTAGPKLKVDLDMAGRPSSEVTEIGYVAWPVVAGATLTSTFQGVQFTFAKVGANGTGITNTWQKAAVQIPNYARLVGDGLTVDGGDAGASVALTIHGLPAGNHTLLTFHNVPSNVATIAPMDVLVNGTVAVSQIKPTIGALANVKAPTVFVSFKAVAGTDVVVTFQAQASSTAAVKNVVINGFELDTPDAAKQASNPSPEDNDEHVNADTGSLSLTWKAAPQATSHDVYFGDDVAAVVGATHASTVFKGNQTGVSYAVKGLYSIKRYYWRIDEVDSQGGVTQGNTWYFRPRQLAFPEAEGYGRFSIGGRGGVVVHVTNLNDSGVGSLRDAVETDRGPRTIVFDVSGMIPLASRLTLAQNYVTVAGQTAPGKGICIRAAPFGLSGAHDAVIRDVRVRLGHGATFDGMGMAGADHSILDHCSISWTIDEAFSSRSAKNITLQRTFISEALNIAGHQNYPAGTEHGYAASISGDAGSFHHNLLAHCEGRNWSMAGGLDGNGDYAGRLDLFNNVVYNWGGRATDGGAHEVNFVGNYYKPGAATTIFYALNAQYDGFPGTQQYYFANNVMPGHFDESTQTTGREATSMVPTSYSPWVNAAFFPSYATVQSATDAYKSVLSDVGANQPVLDDHDVRVIKETLNGTTTYKGSVSGKPGLPDSEVDVGGYESYPSGARDSAWDSDGDGLPNFWETARKLNAQSAKNDYTDGNRDPDGNGYTELDEYLAWMALPHFFGSVGKAIAVDLGQTFVGYTASPTYTSSGAANGGVAISGKTASFTPASCGFASFQLKVADSAGASMTKTFVAFVDAGGGTCP